MPKRMAVRNREAESGQLAVIATYVQGFPRLQSPLVDPGAVPGRSRKAGVEGSNPSSAWLCKPIPALAPVPQPARAAVSSARVPGRRRAGRSDDEERRRGEN